MDYIPGKFQMNITQYPKVQIEYLGEPNSHLAHELLHTSYAAKEKFKK